MGISSQLAWTEILALGGSEGRPSSWRAGRGAGGSRLGSADAVSQPTSANALLPSVFWAQGGSMNEEGLAEGGGAEAPTGAGAEAERWGGRGPVWGPKVYRCRVVEVQGAAIVASPQLLRAWQECIHYLSDIQVLCWVPRVCQASSHLCF